MLLFGLQYSFVFCGVFGLLEIVWFSPRWFPSSFISPLYHVLYGLWVKVKSGYYNPMVSKIARCPSIVSRLSHLRPHCHPLSDMLFMRIFWNWTLTPHFFLALTPLATGINNFFMIYLILSLSALLRLSYLICHLRGVLGHQEKLSSLWWLLLLV